MPRRMAMRWFMPCRITFLALFWLGAIPYVYAQELFSCTDVTEIPQVECEALVALYQSTNGDNWNDNSGWLMTTTPCSWFGAGCSEGDQGWEVDRDDR